MSSSRYAINPLVLVAVPTLEPRPLSWEWMDRFTNLQFPLGASVSRLRIHGQDVATARNAIVQSALDSNATYVLMLGDDCLPPSNLFDLLHRHREMLVTGVYWRKSYPTSPYLWDGLLKGHYTDWKVGEYFPVDFAGCDALLAHTDVFKAIEPPWFSREWTFEEGQPVGPLLTEDFYFYTKARQAGFRLWCDSAAQLDHQDRATGIKFGLERGMPQWDAAAPPPSGDPPLLVADIGAGAESPWFGSKATIRRFDRDPRTQPDVRCDVRALPEPDQTFDIVSARHVLEHFMWEEAPALVTEWLRILKVGGQLRLNVPNLAYAAREILKADADADVDVGLYPLWQVYGRQEGNLGEVHRNGFTRHGLRRLLEMCGLWEIDVQVTGDFGENLEARGRKQVHPAPLAIGPVWRAIEQRDSLNGAAEAAPPSPVSAAPMLPEIPPGDSRSTTANGRPDVLPLADPSRARVRAGETDDDLAAFRVVSVAEPAESDTVRAVTDTMARFRNGTHPAAPKVDPVLVARIVGDTRPHEWEGE